MGFSPHAISNQHVTYQIKRPMGPIAVRGIRLNDYFATHKVAPGRWTIDHVASGLSFMHTQTLTDAHTIVQSIMPHVHASLLVATCVQAARGMFPLKMTVYFTEMEQAKTVIPFHEWVTQHQSSSGFLHRCVLPLSALCSLLQGCPPGNDIDSYGNEPLSKSTPSAHWKGEGVESASSTVSSAYHEALGGCGRKW